MGSLYMGIFRLHPFLSLCFLEDPRVEEMGACLLTSQSLRARWCTFDLWKVVWVSYWVHLNIKLELWFVVQFTIHWCCLVPSIYVGIRKTQSQHPHTLKGKGKTRKGKVKQRPFLALNKIKAKCQVCSNVKWPPQIL